MLAATVTALAASLVMSMTVVGGVDFDYQGELDIYSGTPIDSEETNVQQTVSLADGGLYNRETGMFSYPVPGSGQSVYSSVADGMITADSVALAYDEGLTVKLYRSGEEITDTDISSVKEPGDYSLVVYGTDVEQQMLEFTIVPEKTGAVSFYKLPLGFDLTSLMVEGEERDITDVSRADMSSDGEYYINYHCNLTDIDYTLHVFIDHTPPAVTYEGVNEGAASGPVTITGTEGSDTVLVMKDGERITTPSDGVLTTPGSYEVTVTDDAGNSVTERFELLFYLNLQAGLFAVLFCLVIGAAVGYMIWSRNKLRVR